MKKTAKAYGHFWLPGGSAQGHQFFGCALGDGLLEKVEEDRDPGRTAACATGTLDA
jgi:hypothetical protein